jgi:hypothetical protein
MQNYFTYPAPQKERLQRRPTSVFVRGKPCFLQTRRIEVVYIQAIRVVVKSPELASHLNSRSAPVLLGSNVGDDSLGMPVDSSHDGDLVLSLNKVVLVDANPIGPQHPVAIRLVSMAKIA